MCKYIFLKNLLCFVHSYFKKATKAILYRLLLIAKSWLSIKNYEEEEDCFLDIETRFWLILCSCFSCACEEISSPQKSCENLKLKVKWENFTWITSTSLFWCLTTTENEAKKSKNSKWNVYFEKKKWKRVSKWSFV